jgi:hypothetical protein
MERFAVICSDHAEGGRLMPDTIEYQSVPEITIRATADDWPELRPTWLPEWLPRIFGAFELFP